MRYSKENQAKRKNHGCDAEKYINKFVRGKKNSNDYYDIETKNCLIEVNCCNALNVGNAAKTSMQLGRYQIEKENHIMLFLKSKQAIKECFYIFVLDINGRKIWKKLSWEFVENKMLTNKKYTAISWRDVFYEKWKD